MKRTIAIILGLLYVIVAVSLWYHALDIALTTRNWLILELGPFSFAIILLPVTLVLALLKVSFRAAFFIVLSMTVAELVTHEILHIHWHPMTRRTEIIEDVNLAVLIVGPLTILIQLIVFWVARKLPGLFSRATGK